MFCSTNLRFLLVHALHCSGPVPMPAHPYYQLAFAHYLLAAWDSETAAPVFAVSQSAAAPEMEVVLQCFFLLDQGKELSYMRLLRDRRRLCRPELLRHLLPL